MADGTIGAHEDGSSDTLSSTCTPIIFVPGVMGSRLQLTDERAWDPDDPTTFFPMWVPNWDSDLQTNRVALSIASTRCGTPIATLTKLSVGRILMNSTLRNIVRRELGLKLPPFPDDIQQFYGVTRGWASVIFLFYGTVLMRLESAFNATRTVNPVYAFGYDFRQSNWDSGTALQDFIEGTVLPNHKPTAKEVILISHSMGGLVIRGMFAKNSAALDEVRGVVHGAQPSNGAVVCYTRFLSGASAPVEPGGGLVDFLTTRIIGRSPHEFAYLLSGMAGPLQLLPNSQFQASFVGGQWLDGFESGDLSDVFSIYQGSGAAGLPNKLEFAQLKCATDDEKFNNRVTKEFARNLSRARAFHDALAGAPSHAFHSHTRVLFSSGLDTMHSVRVKLGGDPDPRNQFIKRSLPGGGTEVTDTWEQVAFTRMLSGDGTVPATSARCPGAPGVTPEEPAPGTSHSDVYGNEAFNNRTVFLVQAILAGPPAPHAENDAPSTDEALAENDANDSAGSGDTEPDGDVDGDSATDSTGEAVA